MCEREKVWTNERANEICVSFFVLEHIFSLLVREQKIWFKWILASSNGMSNTWIWKKWFYSFCLISIETFYFTLKREWIQQPHNEKKYFSYRNVNVSFLFWTTWYFRLTSTEVSCLNKNKILRYVCARECVCLSLFRHLNHLNGDAHTTSHADNHCQTDIDD